MKRKITTLFLIALIATSFVFAKADTEALFKEFRTAALSQDVSLSMEKYEKLSQAIEKEAETLQETLEKAIEENNGRLYYQTLDSFRALDNYSIQREESTALEEAIVSEQNTEAAKWLYENSAYYNPRLTINAESSGDGYAFSIVSSKSCTPGEEVTLPTYIEGTSYAGQLAGFGLTPDTIDYKAGETISMPLTSQELYAIFTSGVTFTDSRTGYDSGLIEAKSGDTVAVPSIDDQEGAIFAGFVDRTTGAYIEKGETEYTLTGNGACFEALWKSVEIDSLKLGGYRADALVKGVQIPVSFTITNSGSENLYGVEVEVKLSGEGARLVNTSAYTRVLRADSSSQLNGTRLIVDRDTAEGSTFTLTVTATDREGNIFTKDFELKV